MRRREETLTSRATQPKWLRPRTFSKFLDENYLVKPRFLSDAAKRRMYRVRMWPDRVVLVKHHVSPVSGPPLRVLLRFLRRNLSSKSGKLELAAQAAARQRLASRGQLGGYSRPFGFFWLGAPRAACGALEGFLLRLARSSMYKQPSSSASCAASSATNRAARV